MVSHYFITVTRKRPLLILFYSYVLETKNHSSLHEMREGRAQVAWDWLVLQLLLALGIWIFLSKDMDAFSYCVLGPRNYAQQRVLPCVWKPNNPGLVKEFYDPLQWSCIRFDFFAWHAWIWNFKNFKSQKVVQWFSFWVA